MEPDKAADGFVSYSRKDQDSVRRIVTALGERGKEIWVDWTGIPPASEWDRKIGTAIDEARAFILMLSPDSLESPACQRELDRAPGIGETASPGGLPNDRGNRGVRGGGQVELRVPPGGR